MGLNAYLEAVDSYGYNTETAGTSIKHNISGMSGKRVVIRAFAATIGSVATHLYFMQTLGSTTTGAAAASGVASMTLTADPGNTGNGVAANDNVVTVLDNGTYQFRIVKSWVAGTKAILFHGNHQDTIASGKPVYFLGVRGDEGHLKYKLTASAQTAKEIAGGMFYGEAKGYPMIITMTNPAANANADAIDYVSVGFIHK